MDYGLLDIPDEEYRSIPALSNHELQLFAKDPSLYMWNKNAPVDPNKSATAEFGKALHVMVLEPQNEAEKIMVSSVKGKTTAKFISEQVENPDKIVVTESEYDQLQVMKLSAMANPMFKRIFSHKNGKGEQSIVVHDDERSIDLKIRVDWLIDSLPLVCDLKTTADIDEWRNDRPWINPLHKMGYGHTAAFYLYVASLHYGKELNEYIFPVVQKSASLGRYPVSVFQITREELMQYGFWDKCQDNITRFADCYHANNFTSFERFPQV